MLLNYEFHMLIRFTFPKNNYPVSIDCLKHLSVVSTPFESTKSGALIVY